ncbi:MAG: hypothetical protein JNM88_00545 [Chitinophagaceae bacterium]|nr:hypothetical protein [Chitinophagaceae bacterium]
MITGTWKGKINRQKVEVKIIQQGDSLTGTSYYYESANTYRRYSIKGYFDQNTNEAIWWDDQLLEEKSGRFSLGIPGKVPLLSRADFNCPGGGKMMLDGKAARKEDDEDIKGDVHLDKSSGPVFQDEWDFVIDNYTVGANDPDIIDSVASLAGRPVVITAAQPSRTSSPEVQPVPPQSPSVNRAETPAAPPVTEAPVSVQKTQPDERKTVTPAVITSAPAVVKAIPPPAIEEKFKSRQKVFIKEIPVTGDSLELRFYDNAEIDGDSISLFLNGNLIFSHIRLTGNAYTIKLSVADMEPVNELIMVAENLGAIPPNTSYMVALVNGQRHDAYLSSTEGSSAMIRLVKKE